MEALKKVGKPISFIVLLELVLAFIGLIFCFHNLITKFWVYAFLGLLLRSIIVLGFTVYQLYRDKYIVTKFRFVFLAFWIVYMVVCVIYACVGYTSAEECPPEIKCENRGLIYISVALLLSFVLEAFDRYRTYKASNGTNEEMTFNNPLAPPINP